MKKIGLFYGPEGGNVEKVAKLIAAKIGDERIELHKVKEIEPDVVAQYPYAIMGISTLGKHTWSSDNVGNDWDEFLPKLNGLNLAGKKVALFGLGDHIAYANFFVDSMSDLAEVVTKTGATLIGQVSDRGYTFTESRAFVDNKFVGLPLDEDFESHLTEKRVERWLGSILPEFENTVEPKEPASKEPEEAKKPEESKKPIASKKPEESKKPKASKKPKKSK